MTREKSKPAANDDADRSRGSRLKASTRALLRHLRDHRDPDRGAMAKALTGNDDKASRDRLDKRLWFLRENKFARERADGTYEVLIEI